MPITQSQRFEAGSDRYATFRPEYPPSLLLPLSVTILQVPVSPATPVVEVGSGTGIFTRQLAEALPLDIPIIGIEPALAMRAKAVETGGARISYRDGAAENLPFPAASVRAIVAATAAHWFDRPAFYREALRSLVPGGILAIVEYVRDELHSAAARAVVDFLNWYGEPRAYGRPDYRQELAAVAGFSSVEEVREPRTLRLTIPDYVGLALSSSHAAQAIAQLGRQRAEAEVAQLGKRLVDETGHVPFGYVFQMFLAKAGST